jgi:hypothetical protein
MRPIELLRQTLLWLRYRNAAFVNSRAELDAALHRAPPRIVVDGDEALRAYAASIAAPASPEAAFSGAGGLLAVPPVGRIRDAHRRRIGGAKPVRPKLEGGFDLILLGLGGTVAALLAELVSYAAPWPQPIGHFPPGLHPHITPGASKLLIWGARLAILLLGLAALACFGRVFWQALSLGLPRRTEWRVEYRVPGRLVMVRLRRRAAA